MARAVGLAPDAPVVVALSGGADSVYLLEVLARALPRPRIVAVHVDHGLRGEASLEDAEFCARLAARHAVPFVRRAIEIEDAGPSLEARARAARYQVLCEEAARASIRTILTGHHADDALETLLQRWMRGTNVHGLSGLREKLPLSSRRGARGPAAREAAPGAGRGANERLQAGGLNPTGADVQIVRPLIAMRREEVRRILSDAEIPWREDDSNRSRRFTRNRIRNEFLPAIEALCGPDALENLRAFGAAVEALEERCARLTSSLAWGPPLHAAARFAEADAGSGGTLARHELTAIPSPLRRRVLWRLLVEGTGRAPTASLLELLLADLGQGRTTRRNLPGGWSLHLRSDLLHLEPPPSRPAAPASAARAETAHPELPFAPAEAPEATPAPRDPGAAQRLDLPGLVTLADGRQILAEIVYLPRGTDVLRGGSTVELDARDLVEDVPWSAPTLWVRLPRPGDRFHALGAPGGKALSRFLADAGVPRQDRDRVPVVLAGDEIVWVAGIRPSQSRRVRHDTQARLRLSLHLPAGTASKARPPLPRSR